VVIIFCRIQGVVCSIRGCSIMFWIGDRVCGVISDVIEVSGW